MTDINAVCFKRLALVLAIQQVDETSIIPKNNKAPATRASNYVHILEKKKQNQCYNNTIHNLEIKQGKYSP